MIRLRDQLASQHRMEWLDRDRGAEALGDMRGRRIRLLRAESALFDRKVRAVSRRVDVIDAGHPSVLVDGNEAALVLGQAG